MVGESAELLNDFLVFIGVFIRANMNIFATKDRIFSLQIFRKQRVTKGLSLWIHEIKVVGWIVLTGQIRTKPR